MLDGGRLVVAHAGMKEEMQGRASGAVRDFALFGETTGESDEFGLPVRHDWAQRLPRHGSGGLRPHPRDGGEWINRTICIDTGCVFGGRLTALRWPERELVSVPAARTYCEPVRPLRRRRCRPPGAMPACSTSATCSASASSRRACIGTVTIREENAAAALETMSRFAADPRWLIYLPPTMSPSETSAKPRAARASRGSLHLLPQGRYRPGRVRGEAHGLARRRDRLPRRRCRAGGASASRTATGIIYTRTGRPFFADPALQEALLDRVRAALGAGWVLGQVRDRLGVPGRRADAVVGQGAGAARRPVRSGRRRGPRGLRARPRRCWPERRPAAWTSRRWPQRTAARAAAARAFTDAYRRYCWPVGSVDDLRLAPFHLLATEGRTHVDRDHAWHMETLDTITAGRRAVRADGLALG